MTKYQLPQGLDGLEVEGEPSEAYASGYARVEVPGVGEVLLPLTALVRCVPPEPPNRTVLGNGGVYAVVRWDDPDISSEGLWWTTGSNNPAHWAEVAEQVTGPQWREYIAHPADTAPSLPYTILDSEGNVAFRVNTWPAHGFGRQPNSGMVSVSAALAELTPQELERAAAAMLLVARICRGRTR